MWEIWIVRVVKDKQLHLYHELEYVWSDLLLMSRT